MAYSWDKSRLKQLKQNPDAKDDLQDLYISLWDIFKIFQRETYSKKSILIDDYKHLRRSPFIEDYLNGLNLPDIKLPENHSYSVKITPEEVFDLVHDFYSQTPPIIYNAFKSVFDKKATHFKFKKSIFDSFYSGHTYISYATKDCFIECKKEGTIADAVIATHEYGHATEFALNPIDKNLACYALFDEVSSIFFEMIALDYWQCYSSLKKDIDYEKRYFYDTFATDAKTLKEKFRIFHKTDELMHMPEDYDPHFGTFFRQIRKDLSLSRKELQNILKNPAYALTPYTMGTLIALELYHIYQTDPEYAFYLYQKIIFIKGKNTFQINEQIKKLGINPTTHIDTYIKKLER